MLFYLYSLLPLLHFLYYSSVLWYQVSVSSSFILLKASIRLSLLVWTSKSGSLSSPQTGLWLSKHSASSETMWSGFLFARKSHCFPVGSYNRQIWIGHLVLCYLRQVSNGSKPYASPQAVSAKLPSSSHNITPSTGKTSPQTHHFCYLLCSWEMAMPVFSLLLSLCPFFLPHRITHTHTHIHEIALADWSPLTFLSIMKQSNSMVHYALTYIHYLATFCF